MDTVWPQYRTRQGAPSPDLVLRLAWLANHPGAVVWLPAPQEQDQRWLEVHGEALERRRTAHVAAFANIGAESLRLSPGAQA